MGFSVAWLAVKADAKNHALEVLGFIETGVREDVPEAALLGSDLPTGWYLLWFDKPSPPALKPELLRSISAGTEIFACQIEEHAMCSTAAFWADGVEQWFVAHDSEDGLTNLEVVGNPPAALEAIRTRQMALQVGSSEVDYIFDVPLALAQSFVGFRHDEESGGVFTVLAPR